MTSNQQDSKEKSFDIDLSQYKMDEGFISKFDNLLEQYSTHELRYLIKDFAAYQDKPVNYKPFPAQEAFHRATAKTVIVCAGNRCLRGDQKIVTISGLRCVKDIQENDLVLGYDTESNRHLWCPASASFVKGRSRQFRVVHEKGEFVADGRHLIFSARGKYEFVESLRPHDALFAISENPYQTISEFYRKESLQDVPRLNCTVVDLTDGYRVSHCFDGPRLHDLAAFVQGSSPQRSDVTASALPDGLAASERQRIHREQKSKRSRLGRWKIHVRNFYASVRDRVQSCQREANSFFFSWLQRILGGSQFFQLSPAMLFQGSIDCVFGSSTSSTELDETLGGTSSDDSITVSRILSITQLDDEEDYYDLQVVGTNNYFTADGTLHHNSGKSEGAARELVWRALGTHPYKRTRVPIKAWVAGNSFKQIGKILWPKIKSYLEPRHIKGTPRRNSEGYIDRVELINGTTIDFKTYKQDVMDWESEDVDFVWFDEPPPRDHFIAAQRGLIDRAGDCVIAATPLREAWVFEDIWSKAGKAGYSIDKFQWSSYDNPHTDHAAIRRMELTLTPEERATRIYGHFKKLIGRVFKYFEEEGRHVIPYRSWPSDWPYFEGIDPHFSKPHGVIRVGITPKGAAVIFHAERVAGSMRDLAQHILTTRPRHSVPRVDPIVDTTISTFDNNEGMTLREQLSAEGIECILAQKKDQLLPGLSRMNTCFYNTTVGNPQRLYVMENCTGFIDEAKRLVWDDKKDDTPKGSDDLIDPVRYVIQYDPWSVVSTKVYKPTYDNSYNMHMHRQDPRKYSNKAFDLDEDEDDQSRFSVRY